MSLFGAIVKTAVNVALLPVAVVADVVTMGGDATKYPPSGQTYTEKAIDRIKEEADE